MHYVEQANRALSKFSMHTTWPCGLLRLGSSFYLAVVVLLSQSRPSHHHHHSFPFLSLAIEMSFLARVAPRLANTARVGSNSRIASIPRSFTTSVRALAGGGPPVIQGEGAKPGEVPSDEQQATGLERFELLGRLQGVDVFDMEPLESSRLGTKKEPIKVQSLVSRGQFPVVYCL